MPLITLLGSIVQETLATGWGRCRPYPKTSTRTSSRPNTAVARAALALSANRHLLTCQRQLQPAGQWPTYPGAVLLSTSENLSPPGDGGPTPHNHPFPRPTIHHLHTHANAQHASSGMPATTRLHGSDKTICPHPFQDDGFMPAGSEKSVQHLQLLGELGQRPQDTLPGGQGLHAKAQEGNHCQAAVLDLSSLQVEGLLRVARGQVQGVEGATCVGTRCQARPMRRHRPGVHGS